MNLDILEKRRSIGTRISNLEKLIRKNRKEFKQQKNLDLQSLNTITNDFLKNERGLTKLNAVKLNAIHRRYKNV